MNTTHTSELVIVGLGELGRLFAGATLRHGMRVSPVNRGDDPATTIRATAPGTPILVATGEAALPEVVRGIPSDRLADVVLIQNELFPALWREMGLENPTIVVFWSYQKPGQAFLPGRRTATHGPHAPLLVQLHQHLHVDATRLETQPALLDELIGKYAFILVINCLGLVQNQSLGAWLADASPLDALGLTLDDVIADAVSLGSHQAVHDTDVGRQRDVVLDAMQRLSAIPAAGRSAPRRLASAKALGERLGVPLPALERIRLS